MYSGNKVMINECKAGKLCGLFAGSTQSQDNTSDDYTSDTKYTDLVFNTVNTSFFAEGGQGWELPHQVRPSLWTGEFASGCAEVQGYIHDKLHASIVLHAAELINNTNGCQHGSVCHLCTFLQMELK